MRIVHKKIKNKKDYEKHNIRIPLDAIGRQSRDNCVNVLWRHRPDINIITKFRMLQGVQRVNKSLTEIGFSEFLDLVKYVMRLSESYKIKRHG